MSGALLLSPTPVMVGMAALWCLAPVLSGDLEPAIGVLGASSLGVLAGVSARALGRGGTRILGSIWWALVAAMAVVMVCRRGGTREGTRQPACNASPSSCHSSS